MNDGELTPREELRLMDRAARAAEQMGVTGQQWLAAWLLNTTQQALVDAGFHVRAANR